MSPVRSHLTRALHLAILLVVLHQLLGSTIMERPAPGEDPEWPFTLHVWIGTAGLGFLLLFWLWTLARGRSETRVTQLFPWFSPYRLRAVIGEVRDLIRDLWRFRTPSLDMDAVASALHGLGLMLATFMAVTGGLWFYLLEGTSYARTVLGLHKFAANFMWAYLIAHAAMALLHQGLGDDVFARMFWFRRSVRRPWRPIETERQETKLERAP